MTPLPEPIRIQTFIPLEVTVDPNAIVESSGTPSGDPVTDASAEPSAEASPRSVTTPRTDEGPPPCGGGPSFLCGEVR